MNSFAGHRAVTVYQVDAFTKDRFTGNPAGVVLDARGLSDGEMQRIAFELGNSETDPCGVMRPILFVPLSQNQTFPSGPAVIPMG